MTADPVITVGYFAILGGLGLIVGSFLNVVIYRVPAGLSIVRPGSACPTCHAQIRSRDNIPVLSWLLLRGRCRDCAAPISPRYPLVELLTSAVWLCLGWWAWGTPVGAVDAGWSGVSIDPLLPLLLVLGSAGVALAMIDVDHYRLPDVIVLPLYPITLVGLVFAGVSSGTWPVGASLIGAGCWLATVGGLWLISGGRAMGFGDVKLVPVLGATLGWAAVSCALVGLFAAFALGAIVGVVLLATGRARRGSHVPFGPFLIAGAGAGLLVGEPVGRLYLSTMGL